jgi:hypothetical protein
MIMKPTIAQKVQQFDLNRARVAAEWLAGNLTSPVFAGTGDLAADIRNNIAHASHRIFEKSAGTICLALPHGRDE